MKLSDLFTVLLTLLAEGTDPVVAQVTAGLACK